MALTKKKKRPSYRWQAFTHWLNLTFLAAGGIVSAVYDPSVWLALGPIEVGLLWILPDLPFFRARLDKQQEAKEILQERAYYIKQLWGLAPPERKSIGQRIAGWFTESEPEEVDDRILERNSSTYLEYHEMRQIISKLHELGEVRGVNILERDWCRFEQVINGYLHYRIAASSLAKAIMGMNIEQLRQEVIVVEQELAHAPPALKPVLLERKRLKEANLARIPKLQATLELFRTRAEAIVYQMRNIHSQALADPGMDVNNFLATLIERQEILVDPLGELEADQMLQEFLHPQIESTKTSATAKLAMATKNSARR